MAAAPTILDAPQLADPTDLNDVTWLRACELRGRLAILLDRKSAAFPPQERRPDDGRKPLRAWLNDEIEAQLLRVGASPPTTGGDSDAYSVLCDQVYRARLLGYAGLAVSLSSLQHFALEGQLDTNDSWALLSFCTAAQQLAVDVRFASDDSALLAVPRPLPLGSLLESYFVAHPSPAPRVTVEAPSAAPESAITLRDDTICAPESAPSTAKSRPSRNIKDADVSPTASRSMRAAMQDLLNDDAGQWDNMETPVPQASLNPSSLAPISASVVVHASPPPPKPVAQALGTITPTPQPAQILEAPKALRVEELIRELQETDGTCGWDEIERVFADSYMPLQELLPTLADPSTALQALSNWASAFAHSYRAAFEALRANRGKRPRLVLDVPSHAFQLSRKLEIEQVKMVLVDAMRADLAPIVLDKLRLQMTHTAECVAQGLLWAALPTTTAAQMELIARGTDSLRHFTGELVEDQLLSRGNDLRRLRPVRVGSHRMYKLDIVQYLARDAQTHDRHKLEQYGAEIATSVGRFLRQQGPNTLVYVFGDHGFGGADDASPENVLVPYFAWRLLG